MTNFQGASDLHAFPVLCSKLVPSSTACLLCSRRLMLRSISLDTTTTLLRSWELWPCKRDLRATATWRYLECFLPLGTTPEQALWKPLWLWGSNSLHPHFHLYKQLGVFRNQFVSTMSRWLHVWALLLYRQHSVKLIVCADGPQLLCEPKEF